MILKKMFFIKKKSRLQKPTLKLFIILHDFIIDRSNKRRFRFRFFFNERLIIFDFEVKLQDDVQVEISREHEHDNSTKYY